MNCGTCPVVPVTPTATAKLVVLTSGTTSSRMRPSPRTVGRNDRRVPNGLKAMDGTPRLTAVGIGCSPPTRKSAGRPDSVTRVGLARILATLFCFNASTNPYTVAELPVTPKKAVAELFRAAPPVPTGLNVPPPPSGLDPVRLKAGGLARLPTWVPPAAAWVAASRLTPSRRSSVRSTRAMTTSSCTCITPPTRRLFTTPPVKYRWSSFSTSATSFGLSTVPSTNSTLSPAGWTFRLAVGNRAFTSLFRYSTSGTIWTTYRWNRSSPLAAGSGLRNVHPHEPELLPGAGEHLLGLVLGEREHVRAIDVHVRFVEFAAEVGRAEVERLPHRHGDVGRLAGGVGGRGRRLRRGRRVAPAARRVAAGRRLVFRDDVRHRQQRGRRRGLGRGRHRRRRQPEAQAGRHGGTSHGGTVACEVSTRQGVRVEPDRPRTAGKKCRLSLKSGRSATGPPG